MTDETFITEAASLDVLDTFNADSSIFLLKVALRHPYGTNIVHPYIMTHWHIGRIG